MKRCLFILTLIVAAAIVALAQNPNMSNVQATCDGTKGVTLTNNNPFQVTVSYTVTNYWTDPDTNQLQSRTVDYTHVVPANTSQVFGNGVYQSCYASINQVSQ